MEPDEITPETRVKLTLAQVITIISAFITSLGGVVYVVKTYYDIEYRLKTVEETLSTTQKDILKNTSTWTDHQNLRKEFDEVHNKLVRKRILRP